MAPRILIGLTGNIATGKSAVAQRLSELGAIVIDADQIAHHVVRKGEPALDEIVRAFGPQVLQADGELDRQALGQLVFNNADKLKRLEEITHPAVHAEIERQLAAMPREAVATIEVIKLIENGWADRCNCVWVTDCSAEEQVRRLIHSRGMSEQEARLRVASQNSQTSKLARADVVIDTSGTYGETRKQVTRAWERLVGSPDSPVKNPASTTSSGLVDPPASTVSMPAPVATSQRAPVDYKYGPALGWVDWFVRLTLWGVSVIAFAYQLGGPLDVSNGVMVVLFALLMAGFLLASVTPVVRFVMGEAHADPLATALLPLVLLVPYVWIAHQNGTFDSGDLLTAAVLLFLPTALAMINTPVLNTSDAFLGLIGVALPLVMPLYRDEPIDSIGIVLRAGAFALPVLLLLFTTRQQKRHLNFLFISAVLALWYSVEFNAFPVFELLPQVAQITYFHLVTVVVFLFILMFSGRFGSLGLSLRPSIRGFSAVVSNLGLFALIAIPLGLVTHFIALRFAGPSILDALIQGLVIFLFVALPEEILFRATLLTYLADTMNWPQVTTVIVSSVVFGMAHLDNPPNVGWYFILAAIAGVFYARTYLSTRNIAAAATLHATVDWIWALVFSG